MPPGARGGGVRQTSLPRGCWHPRVRQMAWWFTEVLLPVAQCSTRRAAFPLFHPVNTVRIEAKRRSLPRSAFLQSDVEMSPDLPATCQVSRVAVGPFPAVASCSGWHGLGTS